MAESIIELLSKRTEFLNLLDQDIDKNSALTEDIQKKIESLEETKRNITELGKEPEHFALIPLCKRLFMPGQIVHTGEYLIRYDAHPYSYSALRTKDQTIKHLDAQINSQQELLKKSELSVFQLEERKKILIGQNNEDFISGQVLEDAEYESISMEVANMPKEIQSDKGVAVKVGNYYEIFEYEEN
ncbi:uncharacterized protein LOC115888682 [Sitophilus oryzae]|uniref:Uncharacterized protein LOC115888682 n=1 Tax=Sitophilus oryzae TaxID=7048 RepID=A0A6J2YLP9_SITOR|nr:uncharacterized protein LOC115888682 [Sitophilus oryzae]